MQRGNKQLLKEAEVNPVPSTMHVDVVLSRLSSYR
jgi:hypothetical protein